MVLQNSQVKTLPIEHDFYINWKSDWKLEKKARIAYIQALQIQSGLDKKI